MTENFDHLSMQSTHISLRIPTVLRVILLTGVMIGTLMIGAGNAHATVRGARDKHASAVAGSRVESTALSLLSTVVGLYQSGYSNGQWTDSVSDGCWGCDEGGATTAEATLFLLGGGTNKTELSQAVTSMNAAIADDQQSNGSFVPSYDDGVSAQMDTMFYGVELGTSALLLNNYVSAAQRASWATALGAAANYEINSGATTWYANGNVNLGYTELLWLAWYATRSSSLLAAYNSSWSFIDNPPQAEFPGAGWTATTGATASDCSDGAGYYAETGDGGTGYDPYYTMIQLDVLSRLYLLSRDSRALCAANMEAGELTSSVNTGTWLLNTSSGTRHTAEGTTEDFQSSALAVLGLIGNRTNLTAGILPELNAQSSWYANSTAAEMPAFRRALGNDIATIALAGALGQQSSGSRSMSALVERRTIVLASTSSLKATKAKAARRRAAARRAKAARARATQKKAARAKAAHA